MLAADNGALECIEALLAAGADDRLTCADGRTALDRARAHRDVWITLNQNPADPEPFFPGDNPRERHAEALRKAEACVRVLESAGDRPGKRT